MWAAVAGIERRGFIFAAPVALGLKVPFVPFRKPGKLPCKFTPLVVHRLLSASMRVFCRQKCRCGIQAWTREQNRPLHFCVLRQGQVMTHLLSADRLACHLSALNPPPVTPTKCNNPCPHPLLTPSSAPRLEMHEDAFQPGAQVRAHPSPTMVRCAAAALRALAVHGAAQGTGFHRPSSPPCYRLQTHFAPPGSAVRAVYSKAGHR